MVSKRKKILTFVITALGLLALFLVAVNTGSLKVTPCGAVQRTFYRIQRKRGDHLRSAVSPRPHRHLRRCGNRCIRRAFAGRDEKPAGRPRHHRRQLRGQSDGGAHYRFCADPLLFHAPFRVYGRDARFPAGVLPFLEGRGFRLCALSSWAWRSTPCLRGS